MKTKELLKTLVIGMTSFMVSTDICAQERNYVSVSPSDTPEQIVRKAANVVPTQRQFEWQRQELTAFIHYGVNTYSGREWGTGKESPEIFNPTDLDAEQWVSTLKDAGFKCVILTCKHHDGFCLWPSAYTEHSVKHSPWKDGQGDVVREVSDACRRHGVSFGVYLSPWDMNSPLYGTEAYNDYFVNQLTELLTNYGEIGEVWFDGACGEGPNGKKQEYDFVRWYKVIRQLQPKAVIAVMGPDVRWVGTESGRGRETEWSVVPNDNLDQNAIAANSQQEMISAPVGDMTGQDLGSRAKIQHAKGLVWYPAEIDVSIRPGWFSSPAEDSKVKTPKEIMDIYFTSVGMNGVLLLNVPPTKEGRFAEPDCRSLAGFKQIHDRTFSKNLLKGAKVKTGCKHGKSLVDGDYDTSCTNEDGMIVVEFTKKKDITANVLSIQEDIRKGQRVEKFTLEALDAYGSWVKVAEGTTVGHKRLIKFDAVTSRKFRLTIDESRLNPYLSEIGLYFMED